MPKVLSGILDIVDNDLKTNPGKSVYEFENLSESEVEKVSNFYSEAMGVWGPCEDRKHTGKYRLVLSNPNYKGVLKNA